MMIKKTAIKKQSVQTVNGVRESVCEKDYFLFKFISFRGNLLFKNHFKLETGFIILKNACEMQCVFCNVFFNHHGDNGKLMLALIA